MEIDKKIIEKTKHCRNNFECMKAENRLLYNRNVERCLDGKIHIVSCSEIICHYKLSFGRCIVCNCPVRKEIYRLSRIRKHKDSSI